MSQVNSGDFPIDPQVTSGTALADILNRWYNAANTQNSGATAPVTTYPGMFWYDTSVNPPILKIRNQGNSGWVNFVDSMVITPGNISGLGTMSSVNSPAPVANGGTGSTTAAGAVINLGLGNLLNSKQVVNNSPANNILMSWSSNVINLQVDGTVFGANWPHNVSGTATGVNSGGAVNGTKIVFSWSDPGGTPAYVWGGNDPSNQFLTPPSRLSVNYSASSGYAGNSGQVSGIGGWAYRNDGNNPAYLWCTEGDAQSQHLTQPGALSVNYANSAGSAPIDTNYWINNGNTGVVNIRNNAGIQLIAGINGIGDRWWPVNAPSDSRAKMNIVDSTLDALAQIKAMAFKQFQFRSDIPWVEVLPDTTRADYKAPTEPPPAHPLTYAIDDGHVHKIGAIAQDLLAIDPELVETNIGQFYVPHQDQLLWRALKAIQQLLARVEALEAKP